MVRSNIKFQHYQEDLAQLKYYSGSGGYPKKELTLPSLNKKNDR
jgi:hypothetical protein